MTWRWRTNVSLLAVSAMMTLTGALFVSYGNPRVLGDSPVLQLPYQNFVVLAFGLSGVLLYLVKDLAGKRHLRLIFGVPLLIPLVLALLIAAYYRSGVALAFYGLSLALVIFSLWNEEPAPEAQEGVRAVFPFFGSALLIGMGVMHLLLPGSSDSERLLPIAYAAPFVGLVGFLAAWYRPGSADDRVGRILMGATFAFMTAIYFAEGRPIFALMSLPFAVLLIAHPLTRHFNLGVPMPTSVGEEARVVRQFEQIAKLVAWSVYLFTYFHLAYAPSGIRGAVFALFIGVYALFVVQYDFLPIRFSTYQKYMRESLVNIVALSLISHITGGPISPYNWFFIFIMIGGTIGLSPHHVLYRLAMVTAYFAFAAAYQYLLGALTPETLLDVALTYFVIALTAAYAYRLSARRKEVEESLRKRTEELASALKQAEESRFLATERGREIEAARRRDEAIMDSLGDGVLAIDRRGLVVLANPAAEGILSIGAQELRARRIRDTFSFKVDGDPAFSIGSYIDTALNGNAVPLPENLYVEFKDGRRTYLDGTLVPIFGDRREVTGAVMTFRDVTYLREVDQMKTDFLSVSAHQLRTPLSTARWFLELLNDPKEGKLKENQKLFAEGGYQAVRNMIDLVNRLLAVTRLEAGRVPVRPEPVDLRVMTEELLKGAAPRLQGRQLDVRFKPVEKLPTVMLDRQLSREVFSNLIENAIRYTPDGGTILISADVVGDAIRWSIKDTGIGIPADQRDRIFDKFFRADNAVTHTAEGSGLGLYLAKFIVGTWGGRIDFDSAPGKGTTFHVTIPLKGATAKEGQISLNA